MDTNDEQRQQNGPPYEGKGKMGSARGASISRRRSLALIAPSGTLGPRERALSSLSFGWRR